jgi:hypothetical protein
MSLRTDIGVRIPSFTLKQLTNNRDNNATSIDETLLAGVCDDVQGHLETSLGVDYRFTGIEPRDDKFHVGMATMGVLILLEMYTTTDGARAQARFDNWIGRMDKRRSRAVVSPQTNAKADVTDDLDTDIPAFDPHVTGNMFVAKKSNDGNASLMLPRSDS